MFSKHSFFALLHWKVFGAGWPFLKRSFYQESKYAALQLVEFKGLLTNACGACPNANKYFGFVFI